MVNNQRIAIDPDVLDTCSGELSAVSVGLEDASARIGRAPMSANAFGIINSWMVPPITSVSSRSAELVRVAGEATRTVAMATDGAAADFAANEVAIATIVAELMELVEALRSDLP